MKGFVSHLRGGRRWLLIVLLTGGGALAVIPQSASAGSGPGTWTQIDVNNAIANGVAYFDANQNPNGSWGVNYPGAETALALASYGVLDSGHFANLSSAQQTRVQNGVNWLLTQ